MLALLVITLCCFSGGLVSFTCIKRHQTATCQPPRCTANINSAAKPPTEREEVLTFMYLMNVWFERKTGRVEGEGEKENKRQKISMDRASEAYSPLHTHTRTDTHTYGHTHAHCRYMPLIYGRKNIRKEDSTKKKRIWNDETATVDLKKTKAERRTETQQLSKQTPPQSL